MAIQRRPYHLPVLALVLIGAAVGVLMWKPWRTTEVPPVNMEELIRLNNRGVGHMDQMTEDEYVKAAAVFREMTEKAPNFRIAKINLGIALLNTAKDPNLDEAIAIFQKLIEADPKDAHAHYNLAIILVYRNKFAEAAPHFETVTQIDPTDDHAWYNLAMAHPKGRESPEARECLEKALKLNPYLNAARYALAMHPVNRDDDQTEAMLKEKKALEEANWEDEYRIRYSEMGKYADAIARFDLPNPGETVPLPAFSAEPALKVTLAPGARWAAREDLLKAPGGAALVEKRRSSGGAMTLLDYDRDGRADVFLPMAVVEDGKVRNLLLHNEGGSYRDVTKECGLTDSPPCSVACVGDFDNDGYPDLFLGGPEKQSLYGNQAGKTFASLTVAAGLDKLVGRCESCLWADADQDGDLDLVLGFAAAKVGAGENGLVMLLNAGEAPVLGKEPAKLKTLFKRLETLPKELTGTPVTHVLASDIDGDHDLDFVLIRGGEIIPVYNDRLLRFRVGKPLNESGSGGNGFKSGLAFGGELDDRSDMLYFAWDELNHLSAGNVRFTALKATPATPAGLSVRQATAIDIDLDGKTDIVVLATSGKDESARPVLLHHESQNLTPREDAFGKPASFPADLIAATGADIDGDLNPDLLYWSEGTGLGWRKNAGNGNKAIRIELTGMRDKSDNRRTNTDGIACRVTTLAGRVNSAIEHSSASSGPGQSLLPLTFGLGKAESATTVRVIWPDCLHQAEMELAAGKTHRIAETNRKTTSCPVLTTWDGERYVYVTDCLGAGAIGEITADGSVRAPRPEESIRIESRQLKSRNGFFQLKLAEPMDEVMYLDRARLTVIDHPAGMRVFPDERFAGDVPATQELLAFKDWITPKKATNHRGQDLTAVLKDKDGKTADAFGRRTWLGFAEEHFAELDFGPVTAKAGQRWFLVLHGWTDYPYPESIFAADQAGVKMLPPVLERSNAKGEWERVGEIGFPAGLPKTMTAEVTGKLPAPGGRYRIRTNLQIYWDQIALAPLEAILPAQEPKPEADSIAGVRVHHTRLAGATLAHRGLIREVQPARQTDPVSYDDSQLERVPVTRWKGRLTRLGDVAELVQATDDRHVLCGPGDEVTMRFADDLPSLPAGWERTFVLRTWGYCKDTAPFTATAGQVGPLPFRAMENYPYGAEQKVPPELLEYQRKWNTRSMPRD